MDFDTEENQLLVRIESKSDYPNYYFKNLNGRNIKKITDLKKEIVVSYNGIVPNLFSEGKGVVAEGKLKDKKYFIADKILAKHDENYMPPEVSKALEKSNN